MKNYFVISLILLLSALQFGCVGTIQDTATLQTNSNLVQKGKLTFAGIEKAVATAHNRIRVSFSPATGGSGQFSYLVYVNGNFALPVASISNTTAFVDSLGKYNADVKNLQLNTAYSLSVRVYDVGNDEYDSNVASLTVRTLTQIVPVFDGAVSLTNLSGVDGLTNLLLSWNTATPGYVDTSGFGANVHDISGYNIYVGESEASLVLIGSINDPSARSYIIPNRISGRNYYSMVRAKNSASPPIEDQNLTVLSKKTLLAQPIQFNGVKTLSIPKTIDGFSTVNITWDAGTGTFDRYKIMVFNAAPGVIIPSAATPNQLIVVNDLTTIAKTITVPTPNFTYYIAVVACSGDICTDSAGANIVKTIKTTPPIAPFNGIKTLSGLDLHRVQITWDTPDTTQGVYNKIKVFKSDASGNYNELTDEITEDPGITGLLVDSSTSNSIIIKDLAVATEYCFVVMDYDTFYLTPDYPFGRSSTLKVRSCLTLNYAAPGFLGINSSCTSSSASGFNISWAKPVPLGVFDYYQVYIKEGNSGFSFVDALSGDAAYQLLPPVSKDLTSYTFNITSPVQLASDTYYQVGIKTYYNDSGTIRRDTNNSYTLNCKTSANTVEHKGWSEILALGPKIDGLNNVAVKERIKPHLTPVDGVSESTNLEYAQEYITGSPGIDSSNQGIIKLVWNDFELSNGIGRFYDYAQSHTSSTVEYKVYRKGHAAKYDTAYNLKVKTGDSDWGTPINTTTIVPEMLTLPTGAQFYFGEFIDYGLTHAANLAEGSIYYYKVEAFINGNKVNFLNNYADSVLRVVLPPANMAFAHRWMLNKQTCGDVGRTLASGDIDRENNYRCLYNGFGSIYDSTTNSHYIDMKGDLLVDRFRMGCNFSRGNTANACANSGWDPGTASPPFFEGKSATDVSKNRMLGDCIGYGSNSATVNNINGKILAIPNSIFYDRSSRNCYINTSVAPFDGSGRGTTWKTLKQFEPSETTTKGTSYILPASVSGISLPGTGAGQYIYSNNAYLPPLMGANQNNLYRTCQSNTVVVNGVDHRKRLLRRKEQVATFAMSSLISQPSAFNDLISAVSKISYGKLSLPAGGFDRDCLSYSTAITPMLTAALDLTKYNYPTVNSTSGKQVVVNGSAGAFSTEMCFSAFGLQDISGNMGEVFSDRFYCDTTAASVATFCSSGLKDKTAIVSPAPALSAPQVYTPEIDPLNRNNLKNGNGHFLNFSKTSITEGTGVDIFTTQASFLALAPSDYLYFNPVLGVALSCRGSSCTVDGLGASYDDNTMVTTKSSSSLASIVNFPAVGELTTATTPIAASSSVLPFVSNGFSTEYNKTGRHSMSVKNFFDKSATGGGVDAVGRCSTLIEDYNDPAQQYND